MITNNQIQEITNAIVHVAKPTKIYIFGSYANGTANQNSDVDFLVIMPKEGFKKMDLAQLLYNKTRSLANISKDIIIETEEKFNRFNNIPYSFIGHIVKTGNLIYES